MVGGHSWGAALALLYAIACPDRTRAVVYISGTGVTGRPTRPRARSRLERLAPSERAEFGRLDAAARDGDPDAAAAFSRLMWKSDFSDPSRAPDFASQPLFDHPRNVEAGRALSRSLADRVRSGLADEVAGVTCPVLVLHGEDDPVPDERATELAALLPVAQLVVLPGVGHDPWLEDPAGVRTALRDFLARLPE